MGNPIWGREVASSLSSGCRVGFRVFGLRVRLVSIKSHDGNTLTVSMIARVAIAMVMGFLQDC